MANRKRKHVVRVSLNDYEFKMLKRKIDESGKLTIQSYGLDALLNSNITSYELIDLLKALNDRFSEIQVVERGIGTNINQIARKVNTNGYIDVIDIEQLKNVYQKNVDERMELWQLTRSFLTKLQHINS